MLEWDHIYITFIVRWILLELTFFKGFEIIGDIYSNELLILGS